MNYKRLKFACYTSSVTMSITCSLSPLLFITFHSLYGVSYSLLGLLVLINFVTQLGIDLIFSFFSHKFNIEKTVKLIPILATVGFWLYAFLPWLFPAQAYLGLAIGTVVFSASSGFAEVLISPVIASIPAENPEREMSKLHSAFAWGDVGIVIFGTLFLLAFGQSAWQWLVLIFTAIPIVSAVAYAGVAIPKMQTGERASGTFSLLKNGGVWLCVIAIFLGGASECTMSQWASGYLEQALGIPKVWGDIFGVAAFALTLGLGRTIYGTYGKNIEKCNFFGALCAAVCYLICALVPVPIVGLLACAFTGFFVSMLWPGNLVVATDRYPTGGVVVFALMAAGGDLGASVGPQLVGLITDGVAQSTFFCNLASAWGLTIEQLGMKAGMLIGSIFPIVCTLVCLVIWKGKRNNRTTADTADKENTNA